MSIELCSGDLKTPVSFGKESATGDAIGGQTIQFTMMVTTNAKVVDISGREEYKTQSRRTVKTYKMTMRYNPSIVSKMNVRWKGKEGVIVDVNNDEEADKWLVLKVEENIGE